jgi:hypothetical protein
VAKIDDRQLRLALMPFEFVAWDDGLSIAHPLPKTQRVRHRNRNFKDQSTAKTTAASGAIGSDEFKRREESDLFQRCAARRFGGATRHLRAIYCCAFVVWLTPMAV